MFNSVLARWLATLALSTTALSGCATPPEPSSVEKSETVTAKVVSVDPSTRLLELQGPNKVVTIEVPESVNNLKSIKAGDEVAVTYYRALAAVFAGKSKDNVASETGQASVQSATASTPPGAPPGRAVGKAVTARVTIQAVDKEFQTVTFTGPRGLTRVVGVNDSQMQAFAARLKPGDQVDLTYYEALAARVVPK